MMRYFILLPRFIHRVIHRNCG